MKLIITLLVCLPFLATAQFNLDFETVDDNGNPKDWDMTFLRYGAKGYTANIDKEIKFKDKKSVKIFLSEEIEKSTFGAIDFTIPAIYQGSSVTLKGYLKAENVRGEDAMAALWMRIDGKSGYEFDNMEDDGLKGTFDWKQFTITLPLADDATAIHVGALMDGEGAIWVSGLEVFIDGKPLAEAKKKEKKKALLDTEFDNGSTLSFGQLTDFQLESLHVLGLTWGFMKYHHPEIAKGNYNIDYELFRVLPKVLAAKNVKKRSKVLLKWIDGFGEIPELKLMQEEIPNTKTKADFDWINNEMWFSPTLIKRLNYVYNNRNQGSHFYISMTPNIGNPVFENEASYGNMFYPDDGFRLLAVYKYWNAIQYFFPYKYLIEEDWEVVLKEFVPLIIAAENKTDYSLTILKMIGRVHDTHANIWGRNTALDNYKGAFWATPQIQFVEGKAVVIGFYNETLSKKTGLQIGDIITKVNRKTVETIISERLEITPASNYPTKLRDIGLELLRGKSETITVEVERNGTLLTKKLDCYSIKEIQTNRIFNGSPKYKNYQFLQDDIGYINLGHIKGTNVSEMMDLFKNTKGIIIDIRNYPSEFMVFSLGEHLVSKPTEFVQFSNGQVNNPGVFTLTQPMTLGKNNPDYYKGKVIILVNEISQSQAEYTAMAFRTAPKSTVIGSTTAGADGNISGFHLPGGIWTMISGIGIYYPDGTETQRIGIVPDIEIHPTIEGIKAGKDELLEKAIEVILD